MLKTDVISYFGGSNVAVAKALGRNARSCVSNWGEVIPRVVAIELQMITEGGLKFDESMYSVNPPVSKGKSKKKAKTSASSANEQPAA